MIIRNGGHRTAADEEALMREWAADAAAGKKEEPSMEDILSSIRRILSEDEEEERRARERERARTRSRSDEDDIFDLGGYEVFGPGRSADDEEALMREWAAMAGGDDEDEDEDDEEAHDSMAAEWEAMLGGPYPNPNDDIDALFGKFAPTREAKSRAKDCTRVLNQDEIDSLLGFDDPHGTGDENGGLLAILNSAAVYYERLPILERVIDRFIRIFQKTIANHINYNVEVSVDNILSLRYGDYINSIPLPVMMRPFYSTELDGDMMFTFDSSLVYSIVDVMLGGRRGTAAMRIDGRPYTTIEREVVGDCFNLAIQDWAKAFEPLVKISFDPKDIQTNPRYAEVTTSHNAVIVVKLRLDMEDRGGRFELCIPYSTLEPIMDVLRDKFMGDRFGKDKVWTEVIGGIMPAIPVDISVTSPEYELDVETISTLKIGDVLLTDIDENGFILTAGDLNIGTGKLCEKKGHMAIQLKDVMENKK